MVEAVLATFATSAGTAAAASAATAIGPVTAAASGAAALGSYASMGFTLLSGMSAIGGAFGQIQAGQQQSEVMLQQANQSLMNSKIEKLNAEKTANQIRQTLISNIGSANAMFAARGIGLGSGTPENAKAEGARNAGAAIESAMYGGDMAANQDIIQSGIYRTSARSSRVSGYSNAAQTLTNSKSLRTLLNV